MADGLPGCSASHSRVSAAPVAAMPYMKGVINTANSLVGSSMLAMPFVLSKCGIILGFVVIIVCGLLCETSCHLLCVVTKASQRGSYEELGRAVFGSLGKRAVQLAMCLCMVNCMVVWFVVLGTILPRLAAEYGFIEAAGPEARMNVLFVVAACVVFPISLLKNVMGAIAMLSQISMAFYSCFALWTISLGGGAFAEMRWIKHVPWWDWEGLSTCVPIVSAALTAQTQFFMIYQNMPNNSISEMRSCVFWACVIVCLTYMTVGSFGTHMSLDSSSRRTMFHGRQGRRTSSSLDCVTSLRTSCQLSSRAYSQTDFNWALHFRLSFQIF